MPEPSIHPDTALGHVHLTVSDLKRSLDFYRQVLGLQVHRQEGAVAHLGAGKADILRLTENPDARPVPGTTGLYHFAVLVPSRIELARSLKRLAEARYPLQGVADHLVSEALYLTDPDLNGIEIYRDRPRTEWTYRDGQLQMATDPLDLDGIVAEIEGDNSPLDGLHPDTTLGHVHLKVASIPDATAFYTHILGFEMMVGFIPTAGFVAAGGYHHHVGYNVWESRGAPPLPPGATGLREYLIRVPGGDELAHMVGRIRAAGLPLDETEAGVRVRDPSANGVLLTAV